MVTGGPDKGKGFGGFESLVSDISDLSMPEVAPAPQPSPNAASSQPPTTPPAVAAESAAESQSGAEWIGKYPKPQKGSGGKWAIGILAAIGIGGIGGAASFLIVPSPPAPVYAPAAVVPTIRPLSVPPTAYASPQPKEEVPPVGKDNILTADQIRYCLSQNIRMEAARPIVNAYSQPDVNRFNSLIADYNNRCGLYRYRPGAVESIRAEVEARRTALEMEGVSFWGSSGLSKRQ